MPAPISDPPSGPAHFWLRAETRANERRTPLLPEGAAQLIADGHRITVEDSPDRCIPTKAYRAAGCHIAPHGGWPDAPASAIILGLKELPDDGTPLRHRHIMFGHAYKGQPGAQALLSRFRAGGGQLLDLEYLTDGAGRRVVAFGYWAGYAGAAVTLLAWAAQQRGRICPPVTTWDSAPAMLADVQVALLDAGARPTALIIGALGRVGTGVADLCTAMGIAPTLWDMAETAHGGPFPEILRHDLFFNCILAGPGTPVFVPASAAAAPRALRVIGDIACDPGSPDNPIPLYDAATDWAAPVTRVHDAPPLDIMGVDNLPSLLPAESSEDFAGQLLPHLRSFDAAGSPWSRTAAVFDRHVDQ